jgi:hypothetical protein
MATGTVRSSATMYFFRVILPSLSQFTVVSIHGYETGTVFKRGTGTIFKRIEEIVHGYNVDKESL